MLQRIYCLLIILLFTFTLSAENFDFINSYHINNLHKKGISGENYEVGILEKGLINHCSLNNIQSISGSYKTDVDPHANHVAAILAGNRCESGDFKGGVLKNAQLVQAPINTYFELKNETQYNYTDNIIDALEALAKKTKIINFSQSFTDVKRTTWGFSREKFHKFSDEQIERIKNILITNNAVLIKTASNESKYRFGEEDSATYGILQLLKAGLEDYILIVTNLEYVDSQDLKNERDFYLGMQDLVKILDHKKNEKIEYHKLGTIMSDYIINTMEYEKTNSFTKEELVNAIPELYTDSTTLELFMKGGDVEEGLRKDYPKIAGFISELVKEINLFITIRPTISDKSQIDDLTYEEIIDSAQKEINNLARLPQGEEQNFENAGKLRTMIAGNNEIVQRNFIAAYGTNIYSAGKNFNEFKTDTGSSQAAPIVTGIAVLLHEYLRKENKNISFVDVIKIIKENARQIGDASSFGRGILDVKKLFKD